jgi:hypothetical protein
MSYDILVIDESMNFYNQLHAKRSGEAVLHYFDDVPSFCHHVSKFQSQIACIFFH